MSRKGKDKKQEVAPEPKAGTKGYIAWSDIPGLEGRVPVLTRGRLLNKWAALQDKLRRLSQQVDQTKEDLRVAAQQLYQAYGVVVQDSKTSVLIQPTAAPNVPAEGGETPGDDGKPLKLLRPEDNLLARSPIPIITEPKTGPMNENDVAEIRRAAALEGENPAQLRGDLANQFEKAVRLGMGK